MKIDSITTGQIDSSPSWSQPARIQSMVVQNDGSIILCDSDNVDEITTTTTATSIDNKLDSPNYNIEFVEILSPQPNFIHPTNCDVKAQSTLNSQNDQNKKIQTVRTRNIKRTPAHMQPRQNQTQRFACPRCGRDYSQRKNMRRHYLLECGQEPRYTCPVCQAKFKRNNQMNNHLSIRHGVKDSSKTNNLIDDVYVET